MKKILSTLITLLTPGVLLAQDLNYTPLAPSFIRKTDQQTVSDVGSYLNDIYITFFILVIAFSVLFIVLGGIKWSFSQIPGAKTEGKTMITSALFGLVLALSSWLILNTINPDLVKFRFIPETTIETTTTGGVPPGGGTGSTSGVVDMDKEKELRERLKTYYSFKINDEPACDPDNINTLSECRTIVSNLKQQTIDHLIFLQGECVNYAINQNLKTNGCNFTISGAAETVGHGANSTHYDGFAIDFYSSSRSGDEAVDLFMDNYIIENCDYSQEASKNPDTIIRCGNVRYIYEGDHWHFDVNSGR